MKVIKGKEVMNMLRKDGNRGNMWDPEGIRRAGMDPDGEFIFSGVDSEPVNEWNDDLGKYSDEVAGWSYPVIQSWTDPKTGDVFRQNQIMVVIDEPKKTELHFGDHVRFTGLGGFYSRRSRRFRAHAEKIEKVKNNGERKD